MARLPDNAIPDNNTIPSPPVIPPPVDDRWLYKRFWDCNPKPFKGFLNPKSSRRVDKWTGENFCGDVCIDEEKYHLAIFSLQGDAHILWKSIERIYATNDHQLNRTVFLDKVDQNYIPKVVRDKKVSRFIHLIQGRRNSQNMKRSLLILSVMHRRSSTQRKRRLESSRKARLPISRKDLLPWWTRITGIRSDKWWWSKTHLDVRSKSSMLSNKRPPSSDDECGIN